MSEAEASQRRPGAQNGRVGPVVVVTGASSGIGAATARRLGARGAHVVLMARTVPALEAVAEEIRAAGGAAHPRPVDLADLDAVEETARALLADLGRVDVLINNAGAGRWLAVDETDPAEALAMTMVPYVGAFAVTHALVGPMIDRGSGSIVNVTSPAALLPFPGACAYSVARSAMMHFTKALRADLRGTGVHVGLVMAGLVDSPYFEHNPGSLDRVPSVARLIGTITPEQVAAGIEDVVLRRRPEVTVPSRLAALRAVFAVAPGPVTAVVRATGWKRRDPPG